MGANADEDSGDVYGLGSGSGGSGSGSGASEAQRKQAEYHRRFGQHPDCEEDSAASAARDARVSAGRTYGERLNNDNAEDELAGVTIGPAPASSDYLGVKAHCSRGSGEWPLRGMSLSHAVEVMRDAGYDFVTFSFHDGIFVSLIIFVIISKILIHIMCKVTLTRRLGGEVL